MEDRPGVVVHVSAAWNAWPISWSGVLIGALAAFVAAMIVGLAGTAIGAHDVSAGIANWQAIGPGAIIFSVLGAFLAFALGGWVAARVAGIGEAEPAALHGALAWLVAVPLLLFFLTLGGGSYLGGWYGGLANQPAWTAVTPTFDPAAVAVVRNGALAAITVLLLGLAGSVVGGWFGSGEPMTLTHSRTRPVMARSSR